MEPWMIGIILPFAGLSIPLYAIRIKHLEKLEQMRLAADGTHDSARARQQEAKIEMLEDRVAVLERIVTDKGYDLARQIEALRDARPIGNVPPGNRERELRR